MTAAALSPSNDREAKKPSPCLAQASVSTRLSAREAILGLTVLCCARGTKHELIFRNSLVILNSDSYDILDSIFSPSVCNIHCVRFFGIGFSLLLAFKFFSPNLVVGNCDPVRFE